MGKDEFIKQAKEIGLSDETIKDIVDDVESSEIPLDYADYLIKPVISD